MSTQNRLSPHKFWVKIGAVEWPGDDEEAAENIMADNGCPPVEGITTYEVEFERVLVRGLYPTAWTNNCSILGDRYGRPHEISYQW
jgi:hypothetical protein